MDREDDTRALSKSIPKEVDATNHSHVDEGDSKMHPKKRKTTPSVNWTDQETFALLDTWGERFGEKRLSAEQWQEIVGKVNLESNTVRTILQCRVHLNRLKTTYKQVKMEVDNGNESAGIWVYFKKLDSILAPTAQPNESAKLPSKRRRRTINGRFTEIYEKVKKSYKQGLLELDNTRVELTRDMEMQNRETLTRTMALIEEIRR